MTMEIPNEELSKPVLSETGHSVYGTWGPSHTFTPWKIRSKGGDAMESEMFISRDARLSKVMQVVANAGIFSLHVGGYFLICHMNAILPM